jgi:type III pantothenate kinase
MIIVFNVGNTNISTGLFDSDNLALQFRIRTNIAYTEDQYFAVIYTLLKKEGVEPSDISGAIIGSVVPAITHVFAHMLYKYFGVKPLLLGPKTKLNIKNMYRNKNEVGDDRLANAAAARKAYGKRDMVIIDFGTGITFDVLDKKGQYLGGVIMPGLNLSLNSLFSKTAKLPQVNLQFPPAVVGNTTETSIQSGLLNGLVGSINHITGSIKKELHAKKIKVILTGGDADMIPAGKLAEKGIIVDKNFTLKGFKIIYDLNS